MSGGALPMPERFRRGREQRDRLADQLAADYGMDIPSDLADRVFSLAWEHGHANGEGEVESYYIDFADVAGDAYRAGKGAVR